MYTLVKISEEREGTWTVHTRTEFRFVSTGESDKQL